MGVSWRWRGSQDEQLSVENQDRRGRGEKERHWWVMLGVRPAERGWCREWEVSRSITGTIAVWRRKLQCLWLIFGFVGFFKSNSSALHLICATNLDLVWPDFPKFGVKPSLIFEGFFLYLSLLFCLCPRGELWRCLQFWSSSGFYMYVRLTKEDLELPLFQYYSNPLASNLVLLQIWSSLCLWLCGSFPKANAVNFIFE